MSKNKRRSVGVMIGGVHSYFPQEIIRGITEKARQEDYNSYFFLRIHTKPFFQSILSEYGENIYDYQFDTIHDYCCISGNDGYIINYGTIGFHMHRGDAESFARRFNSRPLVIVADKIDVPNCCNIISDNRQGIYSLIEHLIVVHGCKKILFMRGPRRNTDAIERYQGYLDAMQDYGLPVDDTMVGEGDFSAYVDSEVERVMNAHPDADAFAFSNDEMAASCYRVCEKRGLRVGVDLKITGFDGGEFSERLIPPLTTVFQDARGLGEQAMTAMAQLFRGEQPSEQRMRVPMLARESCGCTPVRDKEPLPPQEAANELRRVRRKAAKREQELLEFQGKSWFIPMMARDLNDCVQNETEFCFQVMEKLRLLKVQAAYLFLLDHSLSYDGEGEWRCPDNLYLASCYRHGESFAFQPYDRPHVTGENGIAQLSDDGDNHQFLCFLLFSGARQYGLLAVDVPIDELAFFYVVSLQLGLSLQYLEISKVQEMHRRQMTQDMEAIRARNRELDMLSGYDQLTGLLNLRGLTERVKELCKNALSQSAYLLYCDLDHLKQINDYFGHPEGNYAITTCASVLHSCIRDTDKLARVGGDEFVCLVLSDGPSFPEQFQQRLSQALEQVNQSSNKPFYVGISVGIQPFVLKTYDDFHQAVAQADKKLYEAKKKRRADVRRPQDSGNPPSGC